MFGSFFVLSSMKCFIGVKADMLFVGLTACLHLDTEFSLARTRTDGFSHSLHGSCRHQSVTCNQTLLIRCIYQI